MPLVGKKELRAQSAGGARRNRTDDLFNAIEALSQLSYDPGLSENGRIPAKSVWFRILPSAVRAGRGMRGGCIASTPALHKPNISVLLRPRLAIDKIADIVGILFLFLEERVVDGSISVSSSATAASCPRLHRLPRAEPARFRAGRRLLVFGHGRVMGHARQWRGMKDRPAFRADDGRFVQIEETRAAILTLMLIAEFWFCHGTYLCMGRKPAGAGAAAANFAVRLVMQGPAVNASRTDGGV